MIENTIFNYFGTNVIARDGYRDANGLGLFRRYNMAIGRDMDNLVSAIDNMIDNLHDPYVSESFFLLECAKNNGLDISLLYDGNDIDVLRRLCRFSRDILLWRGSDYGAKLCTYLIFGSDVLLTITEDNKYYTFDDPIVGLDSSTRILDSTDLMADLLFFFETTLEELDTRQLSTLDKIRAFNTPFDCLSTYELEFIGEFSDEYNNEFD